MPNTNDKIMVCPHCNGNSITQMATYKQCDNCKKEFDCRVVLSPIQKERFDVLLSDRGNRANKGIYTSRPDKMKMNRDDILEVKRLHESGASYSNMMNQTGYSEFIIRNAIDGKYDVCLNEV